MNLRDKLVQMGVAEYVPLPPLALTRKHLNITLYQYLLHHHIEETQIREELIYDGTDATWLNAIESTVLPFLRRFDYVKEES